VLTVPVTGLTLSQPAGSRRTAYLEESTFKKSEVVNARMRAECFSRPPATQSTFTLPGIHPLTHIHTPFHTIVTATAGVDYTSTRTPAIHSWRKDVFNSLFRSYIFRFHAPHIQTGPRTQEQTRLLFCTV